MSELSDQHLLRAYLRGDRAAFDALYRRYAPRVYATAWRLTGHWEDAEDTLQEVFLRLALKASSIRGETSLASWLYRTAVNRATDQLRRRRACVSLDAAGDPRTAEIVLMESLRREGLAREAHDQEAFLRRIGELIPRLPPRQAAALVLHGFQGLAHREVAAILECGETTSRANYSLACQRIREWIGEEEECDRARNPRSAIRTPHSILGGAS